MEVTIYKIIGITKLAYINYVDEQFNDWCGPIAKAQFLPKRVLVTNTQLYSWFIENYEKRTVVPFLADNASYIEAGVVSPKHYFDLFKSHHLDSDGIYSIYPSVLIRKIRTSHYEKINANQENS